MDNLPKPVHITTPKQRVILEPMSTVGVLEDGFCSELDFSTSISGLTMVSRVKVESVHGQPRAKTAFKLAFQSQKHEVGTETKDNFLPSPSRGGGGGGRAIFCIALSPDEGLGNLHSPSRSAGVPAPGRRRHPNAARQCTRESVGYLEPGN